MQYIPNFTQGLKEVVGKVEGMDSTDPANDRDS